MTEAAKTDPPAPTSSGTGGDPKAAADGQPKAGEQTPAEKAAADAAATAAAAAAAAKTGEPKAGDKAGDPPAPKVPDKYELKVPEEQKAYVDASDLKGFEETARTQGMTNEEAQAFVEDSLVRVQQLSARYEKETREHPVYGGDKLEETKALAKKAIDRVLPDGHPMREPFLTFLARGGAGNNINAVAFLAEAGRLMSEDTGPPRGRAGTGGGKELTTEQKAARLYDNPASKAADEATRGT